MAAGATGDLYFNHKLFIGFCVYTAILGFAVLGQARSALSDDQPALEELKEHAATIDDILNEASRRVDQLVGEATTPAEFVNAIRQELTLSRRWNRQLTTILLEVAKARQELARREREAAVEIKRMTAIAEEARLELVALKDILEGQPEDSSPKPDKRSDQQSPGKPSADFATIVNPIHEGIVLELALPGADLRDMRDRLQSMQAAQESAIDDVDAVRSKLIKALRTIGNVGEQPVMVEGIGYGGLTSTGITAWAASMSARLQEPGEGGLE